MKRYTLFSQAHDKAYVGEHPEGDLVKFDEIEQLRAEAERLRVQQNRESADRMMATSSLGGQVLRAEVEVERLRAELDTRAVWTERYIDQLGEMRPVLAAATELLRELPEPGSYISRELRDRVNTFLAAQPAAAEHNECVSCGQDAKDGNVCAACADPYGQHAAPVRTEEPDVDVSDWAVPPKPATPILSRADLLACVGAPSEDAAPVRPKETAVARDAEAPGATAQPTSDGTAEDAGCSRASHEAATELARREGK